MRSVPSITKRAKDEWNKLCVVQVRFGKEVKKKEKNNEEWSDHQGSVDQQVATISCL